VADAPYSTLPDSFPSDHTRESARSAREAERAYTLLSTELHQPRGIIDVTLSDDFDTPNGFTTTYLPTASRFSSSRRSVEPALQTFDSWKRLVIVH